MAMRQKYRVIVIDDSALFRQILTEIINNSSDFEVAASMGNPVEALELLKTENFDVVTLDVVMPKMDGLEFLARLMEFKPTPVIMISSWTQASSQMGIKSLELGAVDIIAKPQTNYRDGIRLLESEIIAKLRIAVRAKVGKPSILSETPPFRAGELSANNELSDRIIAIGASTGGTTALGEIFKALERDLPGILVIQHMPAMFTGAFAKTLDEYGVIRAKEAEDGEEITAGKALVAPGGKSLALVRRGQGYQVKLEPPVNNTLYNPSIDYALTSVATLGEKAMGVILTGMGDDGAKGLKAMRDRGAFTIAQDEKSSVVYGMPQKAVEYGGALKVVPLDQIATEINQWGRMK
jgi:two-component system chemotaxis response regulator CheB